MSSGCAAHEQRMVCGSSVNQISAQLKPQVSIQDSGCAENQTKIKRFRWTDLKTDIRFFVCILAKLIPNRNVLFRRHSNSPFESYFVLMPSL
jgi:hypothetical protein